MRLLSILEENQGTFYVVSFSTLLILSYLFKEKINLKKKQLLINFALSSLILVGSKPILENDQYRYLWEGKVLSVGENPYYKNPSDPSLNFINFPEKSKIGYNKVASIYPPLALTFYSFFSKFEYSTAMIALQLFNILLCCLLLLLISKWVELDFRIFWILPFLMKEYVQAVHVDLIAFLPFAYFLVIKNKWFKELLYWISIWIKWLPLILLPFRFLKELKNRNLIPFISIGFLSGFSLLFVFLTFFELKPGEYNGPYAFSFFWKWNAGLYQFLQSSFSLKHITIKFLCLVCFACSYAYYLWKGSKDIKIASLYLFSFLFFTAHVYNAWYGLWILIPSLQMRNNSLLIYSFSAYVSYLLYDFPNAELLCSALTHVWFLLGMKTLWKSGEITHRTATEQ